MAGSHWRLDSENNVGMIRKAKATAAKMHRDALDGDHIDGPASKWAKTSQNGSKLREMVKLAESEPDIPVEHDELDANSWLLDCRNGTLDLKTGELQEFNRDDLIQGGWMLTSLRWTLTRSRTTCKRYYVARS